MWANNYSNEMVWFARGSDGALPLPQRLEKGFGQGAGAGGPLESAHAFLNVLQGEGLARRKFVEDVKNKGMLIFGHLCNGASRIYHEAQPSVDWAEEGLLPTQGGGEGEEHHQ